MLILSRRMQESIVIDGNITVTVIHIGPGKVRLGIEAPPEVAVDRKEVHERKQGKKVLVG